MVVWLPGATCQCLWFITVTWSMYFLSKLWGRIHISIQLIYNHKYWFWIHGLHNKIELGLLLSNILQIIEKLKFLFAFPSPHSSMRYSPLVFPFCLPNHKWHLLGFNKIKVGTHNSLEYLRSMYWVTILGIMEPSQPQILKCIRWQLEILIRPKIAKRHNISSLQTNEANTI